MQQTTWGFMGKQFELLLLTLSNIPPSYLLSEIKWNKVLLNFYSKFLFKILFDLNKLDGRLFYLLTLCFKSFKDLTFLYIFEYLIYNLYIIY